MGYHNILHSIEGRIPDDALDELLQQVLASSTLPEKETLAALLSRSALGHPRRPRRLCAAFLR